jgi:predicted RNase H-like nuclease (RuvC/YqgF family)
MEQLSATDKDRILSQKFVEVERLEAEIKRLKESLEHEMDVNEMLNDLNMDLKGQVREMRQVMKVRAHPSSMRALQEKVEEKEQAIQTLKQTLEMAYRLLPDDRVRAPYLASINKIIQRY